MSTEAANKNFALLKDNNFDLESILLSDGLSPLHPGSEFCPVSLLQPIFEAHPFWQRMQSSLLVGATRELAPLSETDRITLIAKALAYGNHKLATKNAAELLAMLKKEVTKGWHLPLPINPVSYTHLTLPTIYSV